MIFSCFGPKNAHLKIPVGFLFTSWLISKQTADCQKNVEGVKWPAIDDERFGMHKISVLSMVTKLQDKRCFVNKQLTYNTNLISALCAQICTILGLALVIPEKDLKIWAVLFEILRHMSHYLGTHFNTS